MNKNNTVIQRGIMIYKHEGKRYPVGDIRKECTPDMKVEYVFDIDKNMIEFLKTIDKSVTETVIPGVDLDTGYCQVFKKVPFFVTMRVPDGRRQDIDEILKEYGMRYYDEFTIMLKNGGWSLDNWEVEEVAELPSRDK